MPGGNEVRQAWREANKDKEIAAARNWQKNNPAKQLFYGTKQNAGKRGHEFTISFDHLASQFEAMVCQATGRTLSWAGYGTKENGDKPSIDRINSSLGYIPGNVRVVCLEFNLAKRAMSDAQFATLCQDFLAKRRVGLA